MRYAKYCILALAVLPLCHATVPACGPFIAIRSTPTFREEAKNAPIVFLCKAVNAREKAKKTDLVIERIFKGKALLGNCTIIVTDRYIPPKNGKPTRLIVLCDHLKDRRKYKNEFDPYKGIPADEDFIAYFLKAMEQNNNSPVTRLAFSYRFLSHRNKIIADDALMEFRRTEYKYAAAMAKELDPDEMVSQLRKKPSPGRMRVYATLLAECGRAKHASYLERLISERDEKMEIDGPLFGLTLLDPKRGWKGVTEIIGNEELNFINRYWALSAIRFLRDNRPDIINSEKAAKAIALLVPQELMSDIGIEDLRKMKRWEYTSAVLEYFPAKSHKSPIIKRAIVRFALQSPRKEAKAFVQTLENTSPELVADVRHLLRLEGEQTGNQQ